MGFAGRLATLVFAGGGLAMAKEPSRGRICRMDQCRFHELENQVLAGTRIGTG
jgi:hypothetical protein